MKKILELINKKKQNKIPYELYIAEIVFLYRLGIDYHTKALNLSNDYLKKYSDIYEIVHGCVEKILYNTPILQNAGAGTADFYIKFKCISDFVIKGDLKSAFSELLKYSEKDLSGNTCTEPFYKLGQILASALGNMKEYIRFIKLSVGFY